MNRFSVLTLAACTAVGFGAQGAITYVDAVEGPSGNTFATGVLQSNTDWVGPNSSSTNDTRWNKRAFVHLNGGDVFQASSGTDTIPELTTQVTGLVDGTYRVYAFFWGQITSTSQNWVLGASRTSGVTTMYHAPVNGPGQPAVAGATSDGVIYAGDLTFDSVVAVEETGLGGGGDQVQRMYGISLGDDFVVSGGSVINVFLDNTLANGSANRAWYDGIGYELVPEPSSLALLGLGGLLVARRRRG